MVIAAVSRPSELTQAQGVSCWHTSWHAPLYNITEAGFRMLHPEWSFLLLAIFGATQISLLSAENAQPKTIFARVCSMVYD